MPGDQPIGDFLRALGDAHFVDDKALAAVAARTRPAAVAPLAQGGEPFAAQFAARQGGERAGDGFVAHGAGAFIRAPSTPSP